MTQQAITAPAGPLNYLVTAGYGRVQSSDVNGNNPVDLTPTVVLRFSGAYLVQNQVLANVGGQEVFVTFVAPNPGEISGDWAGDPIDVMGKALAALRDAGYLDMTGVANFPY